MIKKEKLFIYWHRFWHHWHLTKFYYYGYRWHEKRMDKHERAIQNLEEPGQTRSKLRTKSRSYLRSIKVWIQSKRQNLLHKAAEE